MILLDTHVLLWLLLGDAKLKPKVRDRIAAAADGIGVAAITFWEIATLLRLGRLRTELPEGGWRAAVLSTGIVEIPMDGDIAQRAGAMVHTHGDPADRIIMATAQVQAAVLATADREILRHRREMALLDAR